MTKNKIQLNDEDSLDLAKLIPSKLFIHANSGYGKSWLERRISEQASGKIQEIIIDPEGEFSTLREKYDYLLIGKGKDFDIQADPRTAALLAHRLLKEKVSAIIDLYELDPGDGRNPGERDQFVANFSRALVNAPKDLWHPYLYLVDEAQDFAPEKGNTLSHAPLLALAKKGRKRGCCPIFATQRVADFSKSVIAACNNKLIGQASLDIDMKRCAAELGFSTKEQMLSLRDLEPGEFYAFGPAISKTIKKIKIGAVKTSHPDSSKMGAKVGAKTVVPASARVKKALAALADLPQAAAEEATTLADLKQQVKTLRSQVAQQSHVKAPALVAGPDRKQIDAEIKKAIGNAIVKRDEEWYASYGPLFDMLVDVGEISKKRLTIHTPKKLPTIQIARPAPTLVRSSTGTPAPQRAPAAAAIPKEPIDGISNPEQRILDAIAWMYSIGITEPKKPAVAFLAGYTFGGGGFNNGCGSLRSKGLIEYRGDSIAFTLEGQAAAHAPETALTTEELHRHVLDRLPNPERRVLTPLLQKGLEMSDDELAAAAGYTAGTGGFNNPKGKLRSLGLITYPAPRTARAADLLFI